MPASSRQYRVTGSMSPAAAWFRTALAISSTSSSARSTLAMSLRRGGLASPVHASSRG